MSLLPAQEKELYALVSALHEGYITEAGLEQLDQLIVSNPDARRLYIHYMKMCGYLRVFQLAAACDKENDSAILPASVPQFGNVKDPLLWHALAADERNAPVAESPKKSEPQALIGNIRDRKLMFKTNRKNFPLSVWISLMSMAAMLLIIALVYVNPPVGYEVATVIDSIGAEWSFSLEPQKGTRLPASSEKIQLRQGIVKIQSDKGVEIVVEAPAQFRFTNLDEVAMDRGRLVAMVPGSGNGFTVQTGNSKIIDLGTKFGVYADPEGETELHMFKGKTVVIAGQGGQPKRTLEVNGGHAVRLDDTGQTVEDISVQNGSFAHDIDSQTGMVWRGQRVINLADVVGGGSGFGTGIKDVGVDVSTGLIGKSQNVTKKRSNEFIAVGDNVFIDGVFVPNGASPQVVTSQGHLFEDCPPTGGYCHANVLNTPSLFYSANTKTSFPIYLDKTNYSLAENPCILMHANAGITFDLNQYRSRFSWVKISRFQTKVGLSETVPNYYEADFWILVDGRVRAHNAESMRPGRVETVAIEIGENDRFLTLIAGDGSTHGQTQDKYRIGYDWCVFGHPFLVME